MEVLRIDPEHPDEIALIRTAEEVLRGGIVAFPTDTTYGLGCSLFDTDAVEMLTRIKRRDRATPSSRSSRSRCRRGGWGRR